MSTKNAKKADDGNAHTGTPATKRIGRGLLKERAMSLRAVRDAAGVTQSTVATVAEVDQAEVSRLEQRDDAKVSTLRRYLRALGADLELIAVFPKTGHRIKIAL
jgi:hypothetical protein